MSLDVNVIDHSFELSGKTFRIRSGKFGFLSHVAFLVSYGDTTVYLTVNVGEANDDLDFLPLTIEYVEKLYAGGIISSSPYVKREGKPTEREILNARLIDHSIRSLFGPEFKNELQIIVQVLSYDEESDPVFASLVGLSFALMYSGFPFLGPYGVTKVGYVNGSLVFNPTLTEMDNSLLEMFVSSVKKGIVCIEADSHNLSDEIIKEAIVKSFSLNEKLIAEQISFIERYGQKNFEFKPKMYSDDQLRIYSEIESLYSSDLESLLYFPTKLERSRGLDNLVSVIWGRYKNQVDAGVVKESEITACVSAISKKIVRGNLVRNGKRLDGRGVSDVRNLDMEVGILPRVHGSALFTRGETQSLTVVTLGTDRDELLLQSLEGDVKKRYFHHYNMPGYASGEIDRKFGYPNRRSIGHGAIGEKSLRNVLPSEDDFPYTIRVVSEILSSNGSTSMAATCASSLALMDAGVPIKDAVGGVGMGLVMEDNGSYVLLTDIIGMEDLYGDMDFKITGTKDGVTAIQLDNKKAGIPVDVILEAIDKSMDARLYILEKMNQCISSPRPSLADTAPRLRTLIMDPTRIPELIGPGGKVIKSIIERTGSEINIENNGLVKIYGKTDGSVELTSLLIKPFLGEIKSGDELVAEVTRVENYGVFVEVPYASQSQGLIHVSNLGLDEGGNPRKPFDFELGKLLKVIFLGKDERGRNKFKLLGDIVL